MKLLFLGIDALDRLHLQEFADSLPTLSKLMQEATFLPVKSTFPPDSDTAWATIVTGQNPAQHGIIHFVDPLEKVDQIQNVGTANAPLHGKTFWEVLGHQGYKTEAIFPHLCYPVWDVPGVMVARGSHTVAGKRVPGAASAPPQALESYPDASYLHGVQGFPEPGVKGLRRYADRLFELTRIDAAYALERLRNNEWDLFFAYFSTLDAIGHFFWSYHDTEDPNFQEDHPLRHVIREAYVLYDDIVRQFLEAVDDDVAVMILSDHGHAGRPFNLVNVNEILREEEFLVAKDLTRNPHLGLLERLKRAGVKTVSRYGLATLAGRVLKRMPAIKRSLTRPSKIDWQRTIAYASDMSGIKAYTYGGVIINRDALGGQDYEDVRSRIIALLQDRCVLDDGTCLIEFIARREDLYDGPFLKQYPDIVLEFKYEYGLGWDVGVPLITRADSANLVPGSHRGPTGAFILRGVEPPNRTVMDLGDVANSVINLFRQPVADES